MNRTRPAQAFRHPRPHAAGLRYGLACAVSAWLGLGLAVPALAEPLAPDLSGGFQIATGFDAILAPQTSITGLNRLFMGKSLGNGWHLGQAIYSAAAGDAGGAFFWGFETTRDVALGPGMAARGSLFLGGGGGAAQVKGDGLMTRTGLTLAYALGRNWAIEAGAAYYTLDGADLNGPAASLGLIWSPEIGPGTPGGLRLRSIAVGGAAFALPDSRNREGDPQAPVGLVGAELSFQLGNGQEALFSGAGALSGAEGYMEILGGLRHRLAFGPGDAFFDAKLGFGGGGKVDTGAGPLVKAGLGYALHLGPRLDLEASLQGVAAPTGAMRGAEAGLRLVRVFDRGAGAEPRPQRWALTMGLSRQFTNAAFRKPGVAGGADVMMQESSLDLFLSDHLYLTGIAQTTVDGGVSGYAVGLVGLGWQQNLSQRWSLSAEVGLGAAGGGGVETKGGMVGGLRVEVDYHLSPDASINLGLGRIQTLKGGGMAPATLELGLKLPFHAP